MCCKGGKKYAANGAQAAGSGAYGAAGGKLRDGAAVLFYRFRRSIGSSAVCLSSTLRQQLALRMSAACTAGGEAGLSSFATAAAMSFRCLKAIFGKAAREPIKYMYALHF
ncbi:hypothetical protein NPIL_421661 [Nephila pilipes]|uniref:Uncharacterized protein n=1 Tax=Nephila pilipes TaxID=299642 RepID=A0A8X6QAD5_NEPPI|nr:hypothetical protein NPIL_421661 [Nephila pilipes]